MIWWTFGSEAAGGASPRNDERGKTGYQTRVSLRSRMNGRVASRAALGMPGYFFTAYESPDLPGRPAICCLHSGAIQIAKRVCRKPYFASYFFRSDSRRRERDSPPLAPETQENH